MKLYPVLYQPSLYLRRACNSYPYRTTGLPYRTTWPLSTTWMNFGTGASFIRMLRQKLHSVNKAYKGPTLTNDQR